LDQNTSRVGYYESEWDFLTISKTLSILRNKIWLLLQAFS